MKLAHRFLKTAATMVAIGWLFTGVTQAEAPLRHAVHTPQVPHSGQPVRITVEAAPEVQAVQLWCQVLDPGAYVELHDAAFQENWQAHPMTAASQNAGSLVYTAELPGALQAHRRLIRYRFTAQEREGTEIKFPEAGDPSPNFAYFVYDGLPAWPAAIAPGSPDPALNQVVVYDSNVLQRVQSYWLIAKAKAIQNITWKENARDSTYRYTGTLVADGEVYDHVRMRARGGCWRYAMGKNMWKFDFAKGQRLQARDDYGRPYPVSWGKLNLRHPIEPNALAGVVYPVMFNPHINRGVNFNPAPLLSRYGEGQS